jgi:hypothetical protein
MIWPRASFDKEYARKASFGIISHFQPPGTVVPAFSS